MDASFRSDRSHLAGTALRVVGIIVVLWMVICTQAAQCAFRAMTDTIPG